MNRFGISLWNWIQTFGDEHLGLIDKVAEIGFGAVEIGMNKTCFDYAAVRKKVEANGLELTLCAALVKGRDISSFDESVRNSTKRYLTDCFKVAERMNARLFAGPVFAGGGKAHGLNSDDRKREWDLAVAGLREMAGVAMECGVVIGLEPVNRYRTSVVNTVAQALQMVADIDKPNVGILFDTYHANIEETNVCTALEEVLKKGKLVHFHACDNNRGAPGMGHMPWRDLALLLKKYGYQGHLTMETFAAGGLDGGWQPLATTQDELADIGLRNLRRLYGS